MKEEVILNKQQQEAVDLIVKWYKNYPNNKKQIFTLAGLAGCGKSFLVNYIVKNIFKFKDNEVAFATPTGKASSVLIKKGSDSTTIHRLIYSPIITDIETVVNNKTIHSKKIEFTKRKNIGSYKLIVLDEISMIGKKIMDDLLSYGIPILATGD
jgi:exodeoxyribonuclease-5